MAVTDASPDAPHAAPAPLSDGGFVHTADANNHIHPTGSVLLVGDRIAAVGPRDEVAAAVDALEPAVSAGLGRIPADGMLVLPGFVNAHWHEALGGGLAAATKDPDDRADSPGAFAHGGNIRALSGFFDSVPDQVRSLRPDEALAIARYSLWTQLRSGVTAFGDVGSMNHSDALVDATLHLG